MIAAYWLLALASMAVIPLGPFAGLAFLRMAPTVLLVVLAWRTTRARFGNTVAAGLFWGAWGDFFLGTFDNSVAVVGVLAFLIGHVCYIRGWRRAGWQFARGRVALVGALGVFGVAYGGYILWVNPHIALDHVGPLEIAPVSLPVSPALLLYLPFLLAMAAVAVLRRGSRLLAASALVFVASDAMIPLNQFLLAKAHATDLYATDALMWAGFATYYGAQFGIWWGAKRESGVALRGDG